MVNHIYGKLNIIKRKDRPHMFLQELKLYINFLRDKLENFTEQLTETQLKYYETFQTNLNNGINYYRELFSNIIYPFEEANLAILIDLEILEKELNSIKIAEFQSCDC